MSSFGILSWVKLRPRVLIRPRAPSRSVTPLVYWICWLGNTQGRSAGLYKSCSKKAFSFFLYYVFVTRQCRRKHYVFGLSVHRIRPLGRSSGQILLPHYLMNGLSSLDETNREYSLVPNDKPIRFWRSKVGDQSHSRPSTSNVVNTTSHELFQQSRWNSQGITTGQCRWPGYILEVKGQRSRLQHAVELSKAFKSTLRVRLNPSSRSFWDLLWPTAVVVISVL